MVYMHKCIHRYVFTYEYLRIHIYIYIHMYTFTYVYMYMYIHIGDGDLFALRTNNKGQYLSVRDDSSIGCKMSGWGGFAPTEVFEIVVEETDNGQRVSVRAANGKFLGVRGASGLIGADLAEVREDELFKIIPRSTEEHAAVLEAASTVRVGTRTFAERELLNRLQFRDRARNCQRAVLRTMLQEEGITRLPLLATHVWDSERPRVLRELPLVLAAAGKRSQKSAPCYIRFSSLLHSF